MRYSSTNSLTMPTMGHTSWEPLTSPPLLHHTICRDENAPTHSPATRVALWIVAPATVSPIRWRKRVYEYTVRFTVVLYIWTWCRQWILLANICRQLSTKTPSDGGQLVTHILMYIEKCAYKRKFCTAAISMQKGHISSPRLPIVDDSKEIAVHRRYCERAFNFLRRRGNR